MAGVVALCGCSPPDRGATAHPAAPRSGARVHAPHGREPGDAGPATPPPAAPGDGGQAATGGTPTSDDSGWAAAEKLAQAFAKKKRRKLDLDRADRHVHLPYYFQVLPGYGERDVLVHHGAVLAGHGLDALARYLRDIDALSSHQPTVADVLLLLEYFDVHPPLELATEDGLFQLDNAHTAVRPQLSYHGGGMALALCYWVRPSTERRSGGRGNVHQGVVERWTLTISGRGKPRWSHESLTFDLQANRFVEP